MDSKASLLEQLRIDRGEEELSVEQRHAAGMNGIRGPSRNERERTLRRWRLTALGCATVAVGLGGFVGWQHLEHRPLGAGATTPGSAATAPGTKANAETTANRGTAGGDTALVSVLDASGYIVAQRQATVSAKTTGRLQELYIEEGQSVRTGQIIARIDDSNTLAALAQARAGVKQAEAGLSAAQVALVDAHPIYIRNQQERAAQVISPQDFDTAKQTYDAAQANYGIQQATLAAARANLLVVERLEDDTIVRAPFSGVVTVKAAQPGDIVSPVSAGGGYTATGICTIVDMGSLEAEVDVSENFIHRVKAGQRAIVRLNAYPDWAIPAQVVAIIPTADQSKATVKVRVEFKTRDAHILPEMGVRVSFLARRGESS